jgi:hypothetical protein
MTQRSAYWKRGIEMAKVTEPYDISGKIGEAGWATVAEWPMYSYSRPGNILWNAIAGALHARGWSDKKIKDWLQAKDARWALDGELGELITSVGKAYAEKIEKSE